MLNWAEHEKSFITSGPDIGWLFLHTLTRIENSLFLIGWRAISDFFYFLKNIQVAAHKLKSQDAGSILQVTVPYFHFKHTPIPLISGGAFIT